MKLVFKDILKSPDKSEIKKLRKELINIIEYIRKIAKYFDGDINQIKEFIQNDIYDQLDQYFKISSTELIQKEVNALKILKNNVHLQKKIYNRVKDEELQDVDLKSYKHELYGNEEQCEIYEAKMVLQSIRDTIKELDQDMINLVRTIENCKDKKQKERSKQQIEKAGLKEFYDYTKMFVQDSEENIFQEYIGYRLNAIIEMFKNTERQRLKLTGKFLKKYNFLEEDMKRLNLDYIELGLEDMCYPIKAKDLKQDIGVENIFEDEYITTLDDEQLAILNAYWQNKYTKKVEGLKRAIFTVETLGLWEKIFEKNVVEDIKDETLEKVLEKVHICNTVYEQMDEEIEGKHQSKSNILYKIFDLNLINKEFKEDYSTYFNNFLPESSNEFNYDFSIGQSLRNIIQEIYKTKKSRIQQLLLNIEKNPKITNWGYIPEMKDGKNSIERGNKHILIGIDYPGFNMPIMLHTNRENILEYFQQAKENVVIPVFEGEKYYNYKKRSVARSVLMPLDEKRESFLINANKNITPLDKRYIFISHLGSLVTKKAKCIKKIYPTKYIDLQSGNIGYRINGKFVADAETNNQSLDLLK